MRCFLGCFGGRKNLRRQKRRESDQARTNNLYVESAKPVHRNDRIPENAVIPITEICDEVDEKSSSPSPTKKRVTFDSKVKTHEHIALQESAELLQEEKEEVIPEVIPSKDGQSSYEISKVASYPSNDRYKNCRESDDEIEEDDLYCGESDLDNEEFYSDEAFSDDKLHNQTKEDEKLRRSNESVQGVLNPVENLTQWKSAKSNEKAIQKQSEKENSNLIPDQEDKNGSFSFGRDSQTDDTTLSFKQDSTVELKKAGNEELTVDASLSTWLSTSETGSECNSVSYTPENKKSTSYSKRSINSHDERPVLCALTSEEIKQFSAASTPRKSPRKSHDETPIIGTVGGYWGNQPKVVDSGGSVSSFKGIPNTTSKYREDKSVNWHSTPFEARLEKALNRDK